MGLTNWKNSPDGKILKSDVGIAKNYLCKEELDELKDLVNIYLDVAENRAKRKIVMAMNDWIISVDDIFKLNYYNVLTNNGSKSHKEAILKAENEYDKYQVIQDKNYISDFDKLILETEKIYDNVNN